MFLKKYDAFEINRYSKLNPVLRLLAFLSLSSQASELAFSRRSMTSRNKMTVQGYLMRKKKSLLAPSPQHRERRRGAEPVPASICPIPLAGGLSGGCAAWESGGSGVGVLSATSISVD